MICSFWLVSIENQRRGIEGGPSNNDSSGIPDHNFGVCDHCVGELENDDDDEANYSEYIDHDAHDEHGECDEYDEYDHHDTHDEFSE